MTLDEQSHIDATALADASTHAIDIPGLCSHLLDQHDGDRAAAAAALVDRARSDLRVLAAIVGPRLARMCYELIRTAAYRSRRRAWIGNTGAAPSTRGIELAATHTASTLLDGYMIASGRGHGKRLGDATRADLRDAADWHRTNAHSNTVQARFLSLVAKALPDDQSIVRGVLDEKRLRAMQKQADR